MRPRSPCAHRPAAVRANSITITPILPFISDPLLTGTFPIWLLGYSIIPGPYWIPVCGQYTPDRQLLILRWCFLSAGAFCWCFFGGRRRVWLRQEPVEPGIRTMRSTPLIPASHREVDCTQWIARSGLHAVDCAQEVDCTHAGEFRFVERRGCREASGCRGDRL